MPYLTFSDTFFPEPGLGTLTVPFTTVSTKMIESLLFRVDALTKDVSRRTGGTNPNHNVTCSYLLRCLRNVHTIISNCSHIAQSITYPEQGGCNVEGGGRSFVEGGGRWNDHSVDRWVHEDVCLHCVEAKISEMEGHLMRKGVGRVLDGSAEGLWNGEGTPKVFIPFL